MNETRAEDRGEEREIFVISKMAEGFRVYSPRSPVETFVVAFGSDGSRCSCPEFADRGEDAAWCCKHIEAVEEQLVKQRRSGVSSAETKAPDGKSGTNGKERSMEHGNGGSQVVIKRSVSPDGRIDSLSVEVAFPVESLSVKDIKSRAEVAQKLQAEIVSGFLGAKDNGDKREAPAASQNRNGGSGSNGNGAIPAAIVGVGGKDGQWGRRLFLTVRAGERNLRLYGSRKQLATYLHGAGGAISEDEIAEGLRLDVPCFVVTKASADNGFVTIERILPAGGNGR